MGFFDKVSNIFRKKKNLGLPEPTKEYTQDAGNEAVEPDNTVNIRIYSSTNEENGIEYEVKMDTGKEMISLATITSDMNKSQDGEIEIKNKKRISLKEMKDQTTKLLEPLAECKNKNTYTLTQTKNHIIEKFKEMESRYEQLQLSEGFWDYIEQYGNEEIGFAKLRGLPTKIDTSKLSKKEIEEYGKIVDERLKLLKSIRTPEDTMLPQNKATILSSMMEKEEANESKDPIIAANYESIKNGESLDEITVLKIIRHIRQKEKVINKKNEDGYLFGIYVYGKEAEISMEVYRKLGEAMILKSSGDRSEMQENYKKIAYLAEEVKSIQEKFSPESLGATIMDCMKGRDIEEYIKEYRNKDLALIDEIVNNYSDAELKDKEEILAYLRARVASLGQVSYKGDDNDTKSLRYFIENTDFKHPDDTQTKNFLLLVARSEEKNLEQQYGPLIEEYRKNLSFKEQLQNSTVVENRKHNQQEGRVIEPAAFKRGEPDEGKEIA